MWSKGAKSSSLLLDPKGLVGSVGGTGLSTIRCECGTADREIAVVSPPSLDNKCTNVFSYAAIFVVSRSMSIVMGTTAATIPEFRTPMPAIAAFLVELRLKY
jgi:hypothetical protein